MPELSKEQKQEILKLLIECHADIDKLHKQIDELKLEDCTFSLKEISEVLKISKERVRQLEARAIQKMKVAANELELYNYLEDDKVS